MYKPLQAVLVLACLMAASTPLSAHLFYLEQRASPTNGPARLLVDVRVGHAFSGDVLPRMDHHIERFVLIGEDGNTTDLVGIDGRAPAGIAPGFNGSGLVLYESHGVSQRLTRSRFERYAEEEGVAHLLEARSPSPSGLEAETYHRCAKFAAGESEIAWTLASQETGCTLEIVSTVKTSTALTVRLLLRGEPLSLALVRLGSEDGNEVTARTGQEGEVTFDLPLNSRGQKLLVSAVHLESAPSTSANDWNSWWASLALPPLDLQESSAEIQATL